MEQWFECSSLFCSIKWFLFTLIKRYFKYVDDCSSSEIQFISKLNSVLWWVNKDQLTKFNKQSSILKKKRNARRIINGNEWKHELIEYTHAYNNLIQWKWMKSYIDWRSFGLLCDQWHKNAPSEEKNGNAREFVFSLRRGGAEWSELLVNLYTIKY